MLGVHISTVADKSARALVQTDLIFGDPYHDTIWQHARALVNAGLGDCVYGGQWKSGGTWWTHGVYGGPFITSDGAILWSGSGVSR